MATTTKIFDVINPAGVSVFRVDSAGRTYLGKGRPKVTGVAANAKLTVDGLILAQEIRVSLSNTVWSDYVFQKDYKLMPLEKVEKYINKNGHLPEVPVQKK